MAEHSKRFLALSIVFALAYAFEVYVLVRYAAAMPWLGALYLGAAIFLLPTAYAVSWMRYRQLREWESRNPPAELLRIGYRSITQGLAALTFAPFFIAWALAVTLKLYHR